MATKQQTPAAAERAAADKLSKCRTRILLRDTFHGVLALRLEFRPHWGIPTMATDGTVLYFNPEFTMTLTDRQAEGVIVHEVLHCAFMHVFRLHGRDRMRWNMAADYVINPIVRESGYDLPAGCLEDRKYNGMAADVVYHMLPTQPQNGGQGQGQGQGNPAAGPGDVCEPGTDPATGKPGKPAGSASGANKDAGQDTGAGAGDIQQNTEADWAGAVSMAEKAAGGRVPAAIARQLGQARESVIDWRVILRRFVTSALIRTDSSFGRMHRRLPGMLPGDIREGLGEGVCAVDTSGSISGDMLAAVAAELKAIFADLRPARVHVVYCDADVNRADTFTADQLDAFEIEAVGGGGTRFTPVFDWVSANLPEPPKFAIYFTDLECSDTPQDPGYPVLWVTPEWQHDTARWFGETVRLDPRAGQ